MCAGGGYNCYFADLWPACACVCVMRVGAGEQFSRQGARRRERLMVLAMDWHKVDGSDRKMKGGATRLWILGDQGFALCPRLL